jgi:hypothetical protein
MKYSQVRDKIKTGDALVFSTTTWNGFWDWLAQLVRIKRRSKWSHIGMAVVWAGRVWVLEATRHGVWPIPLSNKKQDFGWIPCSELGDAELERAFSIVGDGYGWLDAYEADQGTLTPGANRLWECAEAFCWWRDIWGVQYVPDAVVDYLLKGDVSLTEVQL